MQQIAGTERTLVEALSEELRKPARTTNRNSAEQINTDLPQIARKPAERASVSALRTISRSGCWYFIAV